MNFSSTGLTRFVATFVSENRPLASKSAIVIVLVDGLRTVIDTVPSGTTGGRASWTRAPAGTIGEPRGFSDRTSVVVGTSVSVSGDLGGRRSDNKKKKTAACK